MRNINHFVRNFNTRVINVFNTPVNIKLSSPEGYSLFIAGQEQAELSLDSFSTRYNARSFETVLAYTQNTIYNVKGCKFYYLNGIFWNENKKLLTLPVFKYDSVNKILYIKYLVDLSVLNEKNALNNFIMRIIKNYDYFTYVHYCADHKEVSIEFKNLSSYCKTIKFKGLQEINQIKNNLYD